jgi:putative spermidine/putrescine transport system permease protein
MKMSEKNKNIMMLIPAILFFALFFAGGLFRGIAESMEPLEQGMETISAYAYLLESESFIYSFRVTLCAALLSTILSATLGMWLIYLTYCRKREGKPSGWFTRLIYVPMLFPYLMAAFMVYGLLSRTGWLSRAFFNIGVTSGFEGFPDLVNDTGGYGIVIAYVWKTTPFVFLMMYPVLKRMEKGLFEVGSVFGAGRLRFFKEVVLPRLIPVWLVSSLIVLAFTFSSFEVPYILGVTHPKLLSVFAYELFMRGMLSERPIALAVNGIILVVLTLIYFSAYALSGAFRLTSGNGGGKNE